MKEDIVQLVGDARLTPRERLIMILLEVNGGALRISNRDLADALTCHITTAEKKVKHLKQKGLLRSEVVRYGLKGNCQRTLISLFAPSTVA